MLYHMTKALEHLRRKSVSLLLACVLTLAAGGYSVADEGKLRLEINKGTLVTLLRPAKQIFIANPEIADIQTVSASNIFILAQQVGETTLYALDKDEKIILEKVIKVFRDYSDLTELIHGKFPKVNVSISSTPGRIFIRGSVASADVAEAILSIAEGYISEDVGVINQLKITASNQVNIRVRIAEMSREVTREFGINWDVILSPGNFAVGLLTGRNPITAGAGSFVANSSLTALNGGSAGIGFSDSNMSATAVIDALAEEGVVSVLAEPNLTAVSGETASFFAGGEFPIPINQDGSEITIEFKKFGVILDFVPTILSDNRISLRIRPEVSELSSEGAIVLNGFSIPAVSARRTETTIELASGQSFALAGLLQNNTRSIVSKFPGLGDLPILGSLFRSDSFQKNETELVVIATAYVVEPTETNQYSTPMSAYRPSSDLERIFENRVARPGVSPTLRTTMGPGGVRLNGAAGFYY
ncbi:MAG: type II and III secretion system protein family protein [Sneathiella sp.]|nr:type II and III secretion system protein family protein [Sneathiella sp.]